MTHRSVGQTWSLDIALAQGGMNALHPGGKGFFEQCGHDGTDFDKVFSLVQSGAMQPKAWSVIASQAEARARHHESRGFDRVASDLYLRAAIMYGRAQYAIFDADDGRKKKLRERCDFCVDHLGALRHNRVRRVELDFEGKTLYALLHLPAGEVTNAPTVILGPGMDMIKEDFIFAAERYYTSRGVVALSIEGPGQGQTRSMGLTVDLDNYARAIETYAGYLKELPEVDSSKIGMFGVSMSGYWALRAIANPDTALRAAATFEAVSGDFETIFEVAQPTFKKNFMYMAGYTDEDAFDRDMKDRMPLGDLVTRITKPVLLGIGEFDELTPVQNALATYERITAPKEMRIYEHQFHPLGGVAPEVYAFGADWVLQAIDGKFDQPGRDERHFMREDGTVTEGSADPTWWLGAAPSHLEQARSGKGATNGAVTA
jgi:cephalosporin-C deacetylase-like acetyl esterase